MSPPPPVVAVIPLKSIATSKTRMAASLSPRDRALLLRRTFDRVVLAAKSASSVAQVVVVAGDGVGRGWADDHGLEVIGDPGRGLNAALGRADEQLGARPTMVLPADLPLVTGEDLDRLCAAVPAAPGIAVAPTADGGTGGLVRAPGGVIAPCFGRESAAAHAAEARRVRVACTTVLIPGLALDLDRPEDIELAGGWSAVTGARSLPT